MKILLIIMVFIAGIMVGRDYESKKCLDDMLNSFAATEHLRSENHYLKRKLGIDVKDDCAVRVAYICDRKFCKECNNPDCHHVCDIAHAKNFECISENV